MGDFTRNPFKHKENTTTLLEGCPLYDDVKLELMYRITKPGTYD